MKAGEQLSAMEMMAVDPSNAFWRRASGPADHHAFAGGGLQRRGRAGRLAGGRGDDRRRQRCFLGPDAAGVDWWSDLGNGVLKSFVFGLAVTFVALLRAMRPSPRPKGFARHHPHRGRGFAGGAGLDFLLTATMFSI
jgi:phospholipid/cholesterol/gamma-HCH transport system permease protein